MKIKVDDTEGEFTKLDSTPPEGSKPQSVMTMEAVVDATPQMLKPIRPFIAMSKFIPGSLPAEAQIVLNALFACFERQKGVQEGLIGDLLWGFEQAGIDPKCTLVGLVQLEKEQYIKFQAPDNTFVELRSENAIKAWVRYQKKLLEMVYESSTPI